MKTNPSTQNSIILVRNGFEFIQAHIELIKSAESFILLHTYIFEKDETTTPVIKELLKAAQRGVEIYIILDAFGSSDFPDKTIQELKSSGVHLYFFGSFSKTFSIGRRLHQKLLLIDNRRALTGGINLARRFNNPDQEKPWLDYSCLIEGEEVFNIFLKVLRLYLKAFPKERNNFMSFKQFDDSNSGDTLIKTNENDFVFRYREIDQSYIRAIEQAKNEIYLLATYFLPGKKLLKALKNARRRGVKVTLVFGGKTDHSIVQTCEKYFFYWYRRQGFRLYRWDQSIVHGKLAIIDDKWCTIGSYNHNYLSKYGNIELNVEIISHDFNQILRKEFSQITKESTPIELEDLEKVNTLTSFLTYLLLNFLTLFSLIFLYRQSNERENILR